MTISWNLTEARAGHSMKGGKFGFNIYDKKLLLYFNLILNLDSESSRMIIEIMNRFYSYK
jgi:hypothetical protein